MLRSFLPHSGAPCYRNLISQARRIRAMPVRLEVWETRKPKEKRKYETQSAAVSCWHRVALGLLASRSGETRHSGGHRISETEERNRHTIRGGPKAKSGL